MSSNNENLSPPVPGVEIVKFDMTIYNSHLNAWKRSIKGLKVGVHDSSIRHGILGKLPLKSPFIPQLQSREYWMSIGTRRDMVGRIDAYFDECVESESDIFLDAAALAVEQEIRICFPERVRPLTFSKTFKLIPQDTSPGYPLTKMGFTQKRQCFGLRQRFNAMFVAFRSHWNIATFPCMGGVRNQLCPIGTNKPRLTWVYPMEVTMIEATFALPLFKRLKSCSLIAWDVGWHDGGLSRLTAKMPRKNANFGLDISHFDASVLKSRILTAFDMLKKFIDFKNRAERNAWKFVVNYFVNTWIVLYDKAYLKDHGVPSGSYFTQIIDSLVNALAVFDAVNQLSIVRGFRKRPCDSFSDIFRYWNFLGDDSLVELKFDIFFEDRTFIAESMLTRHNFTVHPNKGYFNATGIIFDDDFDVPPEFLGFTLSSAQDLDVPMDRLIAQITIPEQPDLIPADTLVRLIGLGYSHGTDYRRHQLISYHYHRIKSLYGYTQLVWKKGPVRDYLKHVMGMTSFPETFPSYNMIASRFKGLPTLSIQWAIVS